MVSSGSRIAKNTFALYARMIVYIAASLYTSRIVLDALGASDFGLFSLVGGIIALIGFLQTATVSSTQRFLNFEKGTRDGDRLSRVFGTSLYIHLLMGGVVLAIAQLVGFLVLPNLLNIEPGREQAAFWVFQSAALGFAISTVSSPYVAAIVANERMAAFAYTTILNALLKLGAAHIVLFYGSDKLILHALLILLISILVAAIHAWYARRYFRECLARPMRDRGLFSQMLSFSGWSILSNLSIVLRVQGVAIILNLLFGTVINAALGIATQVNIILQSFSSNFTQALNPQVVQTWAAGRTDEMHALIYNGCRLSFFLVLLFSLPATLETETILDLWLKDVPDYTAMFVRLILLQTLAEAFSSVLATAQGATGQVRRYHITLSTIGILNLPVSYLLLVNGAPPYVALEVAIVLSLVINTTRLWFLRSSIGLPVRRFARVVVARSVAVALLALVPPLLLKFWLPPSLLASFAVMALAGVSVLLAVAVAGVSGQERRQIAGLVRARLGRWHPGRKAGS